jgi:hypothetical protein
VNPNRRLEKTTLMKRMRWAGQAACIRMNKNAYGGFGEEI